MSSNPCEDKLIVAFLKSELYGELREKGWRLMYDKVVDDLCRRAGQYPKKYIPKGAKGFISATDDEKCKV